MDIDNDWVCSCDVELIYTGVDDFLLLTKGIKLCDNYEVEDKKSLGWGYVISKGDEWIVDRREISIVVNQFLTDVEAIITKIKEVYPKVRPILRMGFYYNSYTFTMNFINESIKQMDEADIDLELSFYPSYDE